MSRTYRKNKGKNSLKNYPDSVYNPYLKIEDVDHLNTHGVYVEGFWYDNDGVKTWHNYRKPFWDFAYSARKHTPMTGKEKRKAWAFAHKDGCFSFGIGKFYKQKEWKKRRNFYKHEFAQYNKFDDYEIAYVNHNPDSSWDAW